MPTSNTFYYDKNRTYFEKARVEILPLLPERVNKVLEIGCATGETLLWLRQHKGCEWLGGVEYYEDAADIAQDKLDWLVQGNIEAIDLPLEPDTLDLILCLDVLEHLFDPWRIVREISTLLKPGGALIISIPNVRHHSVLKQLLLDGRWDYETEGILDRTHIRFFTRATAIELAQAGGLKVDIVSANGLAKGSKSALANVLTLCMFTEFFEYQYLVRATKQ